MTDSNGIVVGEWIGRTRDALTRLLFETEGQDLLEYALLTAFIGFAGAAAWSVMLTALASLYGNVADAPWTLWEPANPLVSS
jgi:Flp pilus assembly pilin Flp